MDDVESAFKSMRSAIAKVKARDRKRLGDTAAHVKTHLVLLKLSLLSEQTSTKLASFLRESLGPLYVGIPASALQLAATIFESVYHGRILSAISSAQDEQKGLWESVLYALLSGILDYLDANDTMEAKDAVGTTMFAVLSDVCFSLSAPKTGVDLRCTAYNVLIDASASHPGNQNKLREASVLGGDRLGSCIWRTKDYLALESLLNLFARALPSTNNSASGRARRTAFIESVFKKSAPPECAEVGSKISELLEHVPSSDWEETSLKIVDVLAAGNVAYPQPFTVKQVDIKNEVYPSDRLYADDKTFLANVILGDDQYESLEIAYPTVTNIRADSSRTSEVVITLTLNGPPRLGKDFIKLQNSRSGMGNPKLEVVFSIPIDQVERFFQALKNRGLHQLVTGRLQSVPAPKLSMAMEPANLEIDSAGRLVEMTQSERIENVSQFYRTDDASDDIQSAGDFDDFLATVEVELQPMNPFATEFGDGKLDDKTTESLNTSAKRQTVPKVPKRSTNVTSRTLRPTASQIIRETAFGKEGDVLSDISECSSPTPRTKILRRTSTSASSVVRGRLSFEPVSAKKSVARITRGHVRNVVLDSDEDSPRALSAEGKRAARKAAALAREPTVEDHTEDIPLSLPAVPLVSVHPAPATPPSQKGALGVSEAASGPRSAREKVLRFSDVDIPAPDFNAPVTSPLVAPKAVPVKSALAKKAAFTEATVDAATLLDSSPPRAPVMKSRRSALLKVNDALKEFDSAPPSSSPTPAAKKPVKAALRKKEGTVPAKPAKRKATAANADGDDDSPLEAIEKSSSRPSKRPRISAIDRDTSPQQDDKKAKSKSPEDAALRPVLRARKKYHAKGRLSSPAATSDSGRNTKRIYVDYDTLPSPPRLTAAAATVTSSSPAMATKANKNALKEKATKPENVVKAEKTVRDKNMKTEKAGEKNKVVQQVKTTKTAQAKPKTDKKVDQLDVKDAKAKGDKESTTTTNRRLLRPRKAGAGAAQDEKVEEIKQDVKEKEAIPSKKAAVSLRSSPRLTAVSAKQHDNKSQTDREEGNVAAVADTDISDGLQENASDVTKDVITEPGLFFDISSSESDKNVASRTREAFVAPRGISTPAPGPKSKIPNAAIRKSPQTPWDLAADMKVQVQNVAKPSKLATVATQHKQIDCDKLATAIMDDVTLVQPPSPLDEQYLRSKTRSAVNLKTDQSSAAKTSSPMKKRAEMIDLTLNSPTKLATRHSSPRPPAVMQRRSPRLAPVALPVIDEEDEEDVVTVGNVAAVQDYLPVPKVTTKRSGQAARGVKFVSGSADTSKGPVKQLPRANAQRKREILADVEEVVEKPVYSNDPTMQRIAEVLNDIHDVVVHKITNKFDGVREDVRIGRDELLRYAAEDLHIIRAESVAHFNKLVDLEAEYATVGRNIIHDTEDWAKVNKGICREIQQALEAHDRGMLSKKMPATLVPLKL